MSKMSKAIAALGVVAGLGVAALPLSSYAVAGKTATATTTAQAIVGDSIAISVVDGTVTISNVTANQDPKSASTEVTVTTNNLAGYKVTIEDTDGVTAMKNTDTNSSATIAAKIPAKGQTGWGFKASSEAANVDTTASASYRALGSDAMDLATKNAASSNTGDVITLTFGVSVNNAVPAGTYTNEVTLTATTL